MTEAETKTPVAAGSRPPQPYKVVQLIIYTDGRVSSSFNNPPGSGKPPMPVTQRELNRLHNALRHGHKKHIGKYRRDARTEATRTQELANVQA